MSSENRERLERSWATSPGIVRQGAAGKPDKGIPLTDSRPLYWYRKPKDERAWAVTDTLIAGLLSADPSRIVIARNGEPYIPDTNPAAVDLTRHIGSVALEQSETALHPVSNRSVVAQLPYALLSGVRQKGVRGRPIDLNRRIDVSRRILLDLYVAATEFVRPLWVGVSLREGDYSRAASPNLPKLVGYAAVRWAVEELVRFRLAHIKKGRYTKHKYGGFQTIIRATPKLLAYFNRLPLTSVALDSERPLVIVKRKNEADLPTPNTKQVKRWREVVAGMNELLRAHDCRLELTTEQRRAMTVRMLARNEWQRANPEEWKKELIGEHSFELTRTFNEDVAGGGRFTGAFYQNIPSDFRRYIRLGDEKTNELDYSCTFPALLYARAGLPCPKECYALPGYDDRDSHRSLVKLAVNVRINAGTPERAVKSLRHRWMKEHGKAWPSWKSKVWSGLPHVDSPNKARLVAEEIVDLIPIVHGPIAQFFYADVWKELFRTESDIAFLILASAVQRAMPLCPVHDSFVCKQSQVEELRDVMVASWRVSTGQEPLIKPK